MNLRIALVCASLLVSLPALAQDQPRGLPPFLQDLNLTSQQQTQIQKILKDSHEKMKPQMELMKKNREETESKIEALLTPSQLEAYQQKQEEMRNNRPMPPL